MSNAEVAREYHEKALYDPAARELREWLGISEDEHKAALIARQVFNAVPSRGVDGKL